MNDKNKLNKMKYKKKYFLILMTMLLIKASLSCLDGQTLTSIVNDTSSQITIDAGRYTVLCNYDEISDTITLGGDPTIEGDYKDACWSAVYKWNSIIYTTNDLIDDSTSLNPRIKMSPANKDTITFYIYVTDLADSIHVDSVQVVSSTYGCLDESYYIQKGDTVVITPDCASNWMPFSCTWLTDYNIDSLNLLEAKVWPNIDTVYKYKISDAVGCSIQSYVNIYVSPTNNREDTQNKIGLYPNPIKENSILYFENWNKKKEIFFYDMEGTLIAFKETNNNTLNIAEHLKYSGTYIYIVKINDEIEAKGKIVYAK